MGELKVVFSPRSQGDLQSLVSFVRRASGSAPTAERLGVSLIERALTLSTFPERGRVVPEIGDQTVREIMFKSYRIVYRITPAAIQILRFWHAARGTPEISIDEF